MRATLITAERFAGEQRKLGWFALQGLGLYFEAGGLLWGSHTSYHVDGNVFRTSPATGGRARFQGRQLPLSEFASWHQLGVVMLQKEMLDRNPTVKSRDRRAGNVIVEVPMDLFPATALNIVLELVHSSQPHLLSHPDLQPPPEAVEHRMSLGPLNIVATLLGHDTNLLVRPILDGVIVSHFNNRFTANASGVRYAVEAYGGGNHEQEPQRAG